LPLVPNRHYSKIVAVFSEGSSDIGESDDGNSPNEGRLVNTDC